MAEKNYNFDAMEQELQQKQRELQRRIAENARILWKIAVKQQKLQGLQQKKLKLQRKIAELQEAERKLQCQNDGARIKKKN